MNSIRIGVTVLVLGVLGCQDPDNDRGVSRDQMTLPTGSSSAHGSAASAPQAGIAPAAVGSGSAPTSTATADAEVPAAAKLADEHIVALLDAANDKEIEESARASKESKDKDVKAFAKMMVDHHGKAKKDQAVLLASINMKPAENEVVQKLREETATSVEKLSKLDGADLDAAYVQMMLADHQKVLDMVDDMDLPLLRGTPIVLSRGRL